MVTTNLRGEVSISIIVHVIGIAPDGNIILRCSRDTGMPREMNGILSMVKSSTESRGFQLDNVRGIAVPEGRFRFIFDKRNRRIAKIIKIFGPTLSPYLKARPMGEKGRILNMVGKELFLK